MNLEELQIKIGIELKELNKQLKKASNDINEYLGPKATKKMMADNNKAIKRGLDEIRRTTKYSIKQMRKDTTEEIDDMSKDIHKSLTKAFDIDKVMVKFNKNIDSSMAQAKRSVKNACNDIRKELNAALNVRANIRVSASTSASRQSSGSRGDTASIIASVQYNGAMIVKAINGMIDTNNKNTVRLEGAINKSTNKIVAAITKSASANSHNPSRQKRATKVIIPKEATTTTRGNLVGQPYGPDNKALTDALKNTYKAINILNRNLGALNSLKNIKQLGTGSYGSNNPQSGTVNWRQGRKGQTIPSFEGELVDPEIIPVQPFKQIQDIIEVINYEIKDFETGLVKVGSRAVSVAKALKELGLSKTGGYPLRGEVIDSGKLIKNKGITQKEVIIPAEFKVIDDELQQQINDAVKNIKVPKLNTPGSAIKGDLAHFTEEFDTTLSELAHSLDPRYFEETFSSLKNWVKPLEESLDKIKSIGKALDMGEIDIDTSDARNQIEALTASYKALIDACKTGNASKVMELFPQDGSTSSNSGKRQYPPAPPINKGTGSSNKGGKPPRPTILGFGFGAYKNELELLGNLAKKVGAKIKKALSTAFHPTAGPAKLHSALTRIEQKAVSVFNNIRIKASSIFSKIATPIKNVANKISSSFKSAMSRTSSLVKTYSAVIKTHLSKAFNGIKSTKLYTSIASGLNKAKAAVSKFASKVRPILNKAFDGIKVGAKVAKGIASGLNKAKGVLSKFASSCKTIWGKIKQIFSKGAGDASKATGKLTSGLKALLAQALGFFSLYALINLGKQAITQSQTLAQSEVKLTSLMKQRMGATNETVKAIRNLAKEQANLGVVSETAMVRGAEQLSMYVHSAKALQTLMPAIANMTARRGGFNATEDDAEEIATQLGEAIREGTTTPLEQSGIYLSEAEIKKFQALRTEEERAAYLADVIAENIGDINKALANTPHGQIAQLKNNFKALLGTLGTLLVNVIQPIVKWLNVVVVAANNALKALGELLGFDMTGGGLSGVDLGTGSAGTGTSGVDSVTDSYEDAADAADKATEANEKFKGSLMGFDEINTLSNNMNDKDSDSGSEELDPTDITPGDAGQLIPTEMTEGDSIFSKFGEKMKAFIDEVLEPFKAAWDLLGERWKTAWADLIDSFKNFCDSLASFLKSVWDNGGKEFVQHMAEIVLACGIAAMEIGGTILDALAKLWDHLDPEKNMHTQRLLDVLNEVAPKLRDFILGLNEHLENLLEYGGQDVLNAMGDCFMDLAAAAVNSFGVIIDAVDGLIDHLDPKFNQDTRNMLQAVADAFHATGQAAWDFSELLRSTLENGGQEVINAFGTFGVNLIETAAKVTTTVMESFSELFDYIDPANNSNTRQALKNWEDAFYSLGDAALEFADLFESVMDNGGQEVVNKLGDAFVSLGGLVGTAVKEIGDALDGLFEHLDPATNQFTKDFLKAWERAFDEVSKMFNSFGDLLGSSMDNGGQELLNSVGDLGVKLGEAFGVIVEEVSKTLGELFDHMDPAKNPHSKKMLESIDGLVDSITEFVDACIKAFQKFMDNGGREFVKNVGDIVAIVIDLAAAFGSGIIDIITGFINSWAGQALIEGVAKALEWVSEKLVGLSDAFEIVKDIFQNIVDIIVGIFEGDSEKVGKAFANLVKNAFKLTGELLQWLWDIGCDIVEGLVKGICALPKLLWEAVKFIFDTIVNFFKELFGIHSPSTVFAELGGFLIEGLVKGVEGAISLVTGAFKKIGEAILGAAKEIVKNVSEKFKETKEAINEKLKETKEVVSEKWKEIKQTVSDRAKESYEIAKENWSNLKETVSEKTKETYNSIKENWKNVKDTAVEIFKGTYEVVKDNWTKIKDTVSDKAKDTYEIAKDKWANLKQVTSDRFKETYDIIKDKFTNIRETVKTKATQTFEDVSSTWTKVKDDAATKLEQIRTDAEKRYNDVKNTIVSKINEAKTGILEKWEEVRTKTNESIENVRKTAEDKYNNVKETIVKRLDEIKSTTGSKWEEIKKSTGDSVEKIRQEAETQYGKIKDSLVKTLENTKSTMATVWGNIKTDAISKVTTIANEASNKFAEIKTKFSSKLDEVKSTLGPKWDNLKTQASTKASEVAKKAESAFSNIGSKAGDALEKAKKSIDSGLSSIGRLFKNVSWSLPKIKLPHFKITGSFSLNPPSVPKFGVEWYKRGGIIDGITPLGFTGGTMHMGGEAGKEMVVPLENTSFTSKIAQAMGQAVDNAMARNYNNMPNNNNNNSENRDVVLQLDGREFARASINSINKLQRESGRTLLDI